MVNVGHIFDKDGYLCKHNVTPIVDSMMKEISRKNWGFSNLNY